MFHELEELDKFEIAVSNPYIGTQSVNIGIKLIKNYKNSEISLTTNSNRTIVKHTRLNFKMHFEIECQGFKHVQ